MIMMMVPQLILIIVVARTFALPPPTGVQIIQKNPNATDAITGQQEEVKKIVADHPSDAPEYPIVTKQEPQREIDKLTVEDLKTKCQQLAKLLNLKNSSEEGRPSNHKYPENQRRPNYVPARPLFSRYPATIRPNGFYVTAPPTTKRPTSSSTTAPPVKYIRLEPVILQKTILADGRTVYYWHRSLPTAVEYPNPQDGLNGYHGGLNYQNGNAYNYPSLVNDYYVQNQQTERKSDEPTTESTTTTTEESYGYGLSNFIPFYGYRQEPSTLSSSTTEPPTTPTNTKFSNENPLDMIYAQQLKFVIPVPIEDNNYGGTVRQPWDFDPMAYYPKSLQPNTVNIQVPYTPTFHVIRAVTVPKFDDIDKEDVDEVEG